MYCPPNAYFAVPSRVFGAAAMKPDNDGRGPRRSAVEPPPRAPTPGALPARRRAASCASSNQSNRSCSLFLRDYCTCSIYDRHATVLAVGNQRLAHGRRPRGLGGSRVGVGVTPQWGARDRCHLATLLRSLSKGGPIGTPDGDAHDDDGDHVARAEAPPQAHKRRCVAVQRAS